MLKESSVLHADVMSTHERLHSCQRSAGKAWNPEHGVEYHCDLVGSAVMHSGEMHVG